MKLFCFSTIEWGTPQELHIKMDNRREDIDKYLKAFTGFTPYCEWYQIGQWFEFEKLRISAYCYSYFTYAISDKDYQRMKLTNNQPEYRPMDCPIDEDFPYLECTILN